MSRHFSFKTFFRSVSEYPVDGAQRVGLAEAAESGAVHTEAVVVQAGFGVQRVEFAAGERIGVTVLRRTQN